MKQPWYVRINRDDKSRTYKGPLSALRAQHEAAAWRSSFPEYVVDYVEVTPEVRADVRRFDKAVKSAGRYYPTEVAV